MTSKRDSERKKPEKDKRPKVTKEKLRDLSDHGEGEQPKGGRQGQATYIGTQWNCCGE